MTAPSNIAHFTNCNGYANALKIPLVAKKPNAIVKAKTAWKRCSFSVLEKCQIDPV